MKINQVVLLICLLLSCTLLYGQGYRHSENSFFLQLGVGKTVYSHHQQIGFSSAQKSNAVIGEIGMEKGYWRLGVYAQTDDQYQFSTFHLSQKDMGVYGKLNLAPLIRMLPYGIDPYLHAGVGMTKGSFQNMNSEQGSPMYLSQMNKSFGAGLDIGRKLVIIGIHYSYSPSKMTFNDVDLGELNFFTSTHNLQVRASIRLSSRFFGKSKFCPKFGKKKKGFTAF